MAGFSFLLTERCNWDCEYCYFPSVKNPTDTTIDILRKHLPYINRIINRVKPNVYIDIQGGEVGLLPAEVLAFLLKSINIPVVISTNGVFLEKEYHTRPDIRPYIKQINYHLIQTPNDVAIPDYIDDGIQITRGIVHSSIEEMVMFINNNEHITFDFVELEYDIHKERTTDIDEYRRFWTTIQDIPNITNDAKIRIKSRINEQPECKDKCRRFHQCVSFDMVNETICMCQRVPQHCMPLTEDNLIKRLTNYPKDLFGMNAAGCKSCTRLYFDKSPRTIADTLLLRRKFR